MAPEAQQLLESKLDILPALRIILNYLDGYKDELPVADSHG